MVLSWCIPMVLIAFVLMTPVIGDAKSIKIWPDQLKPMEPNSQYWQSVIDISNGYFYAPFTLPLGAKITKVIYYHFAEGPGSTMFKVFRAKMESREEETCQRILDRLNRSGHPSRCCVQ